MTDQNQNTSGLTSSANAAADPPRQTPTEQVVHVQGKQRGSTDGFCKKKEEKKRFGGLEVRTRVTDHRAAQHAGKQ